MADRLHCLPLRFVAVHWLMGSTYSMGFARTSGAPLAVRGCRGPPHFLGIGN
jgi:hypothetical protein